MGHSLSHPATDHAHDLAWTILFALLMAAVAWLFAPQVMAAPLPDAAERSRQALSLIRPGNPVDGDRKVGETPKSLGPSTGLLLVRSGSRGNAAPAASSGASRPAQSAKPAKPARPIRAAKPAKPAKPARAARPARGIKSPSVGPVGTVGLINSGSSLGSVGSMSIRIPGVSRSNRGRGNRGGDDD